MQHITHMAGHFLQRSRHQTVFFFRRRVPTDLQAMLNRQQVYRSLQTSDRREAIILARALAARTDELFAELRTMSKKRKERPQQGVAVEWIYKIDFDVLGNRTSERVETQPHDSEQDKAEARAFAQSLRERVHRQPLPSENPTKSESGGMSLAEAIEWFLPTIGRQRTRNAYQTALRRVAEPFFGSETRIAAIDQAAFARYVRHVFSDPARKHSTKEGYVVAFTSMFSSLRAHFPNGVSALFTHKLIPPKSTSDADERDPFTLDELRTIVRNARRYRESQPSKFWATVGCAFLGCRLEELCQANIETDLRQKGDVWYLDFNENADPNGTRRKRLKQKTSRRHTPIHPALMHAGFLEYLNAQLAKGYTRPFESEWRPYPDRPDGEVKWSHGLSKWGGREKRRLQSTGKLSTHRNVGYFHSLRHSFAQTLAEKGIGVEYRAALQGQSVDGGGENANRYVNLRESVEVLAEKLQTGLADYVALLADTDEQTEA